MPNTKRDWTASDLAALPDDGNRYEVLDGTRFVTPAPSFDHQAAVRELTRLLSDYLDRERIGYLFTAPADVRFSERRLVQPDVFVIPPNRGRQPRCFEDVGHLLLAVEVLSPATARADRIAKRTVYREESVDVYWVVDLDSRAIERSTPADPRVDVFADRIQWNPTGARQPLDIDLADYFTRALDR